MKTLCQISIVLCVALASFPILVGFQNCSGSNFSPAAANNSALATGNPSVITNPPACTQTCTITNGVGVQSCATSSAPASTCVVTMCDSGYVVQNGACVLAPSTKPFACTSYQQLTLDMNSNQLMTVSGKTIPAQDSSGVCYYYPIYGGTTISGSSYLTGTASQYHDQTVISRDHDVSSGNPLDVWHPYILAHGSFNINLAGARSLQLTSGSLSGNTFQTAPISIDNFFLVGVYPAAGALSVNNVLSFYSAWGTGDSTVAVHGSTTASSGIAFNPAGITLVTDATDTYSDGSQVNYSDAGLVTSSQYVIVPLTVEATGGTAQVPAVSLNNYIYPGVLTTVDFHALDAGGGRYLSDIYLLVQ